MGQIIFLSLAALLLFGLCLFFGWMLIGLARCQVPFVPSSKRIARLMVELADIHAGDKVYDLGCGSGTILFEAEKKGGKCIGYEIIPSVIFLARTKKVFKKSKIEFRCKDFFKQDLSDADVIFCYLWTHIMEKIYQQIWPKLKPGTKLISHGFSIKNITPEKIIESGRTKIFLYEKK